MIGEPPPDAPQRTFRGLAWVVVGLTVLLVWLGWGQVAPVLREVVRAVDSFAFGLYNLVAAPLNDARSSAAVPLLAPLLLGLMASTAPCQLSTGTATLAFVAQDGRPNGALARGIAFVAARLVFYVAVGAVAMYALGGSVQAPGEALTAIRKAIGPLTVMIGLVTLGALPFRFGFGAGASERASRLVAGRGGTLGAFLLGFAFSFAFCPTLFLLFFGLTVPLALVAPLGFAYPAAFALGMSLPLLVFAWLISSIGAASETSAGFLRWLRRARRVLTPLAGAVFVVAGVYDTLRYWLVA